MKSSVFNIKRKIISAANLAAAPNKIVIAAAFTFILPLSIFAQQAVPKNAPATVQPGAPGQPTKVLPSTTRAKLPPRSAKDTEFMQGMIHHHAQAVEMTALIAERTENKNVRLLGARISQSQSDEMNFMKRWLENRGEPAAMPMPKTDMKMPGMEMPEMNMPGMEMPEHTDHLMPGMLSPKQMNALKNAKGAQFDELFLKGMIQHHEGALQMVKDMFATGGAGQDAELFNFATDVDSGQRAEIKIMQNLLGEKP